MGSDWRKIDDDKKKYQAYLCSREWGKLKEAVRERAGGRCERCRVLPMDATHHLTYERKYKEQLEDLQANCNHCHNFTHGKSNFDPQANIFVIRYLNGAKADGVLGAPYELVVREVSPIDFKPEYGVTLFAVEALQAVAPLIWKYQTLVTDDKWVSHMYDLDVALDELTSEVESAKKLPFRFYGIPEGVGAMSREDYAFAAEVVGVQLAQVNDFLVDPINYAAGSDF